jgi:urease accessory protein
MAIIMGILMNPDLLTVTQWLSPAFPLGSFAYSHGLEAAVEAGEVRDADALATWIGDVLRYGAGKTDAILLCQSLAGQDISELASALAASKERLEETQAQGRAFAETLNGFDAGNPEIAHAPLPVALGVAARELSLADQELASLYLHAFASNLVSVGVRFIPLGQTAGQKALAALHPMILEVAEQAAEADLSDLGSAAFGADLMAMRHETQEVRIFKT